MTLRALVEELRDIAMQADEKRLSVWIDQFKAEFPELHNDLVACQQMPSPELALGYLIAKDIRFAAIKFFPNHMRMVSFVHKFMNERAADKPAPRARRKKLRS
jgi:hypothetical protein